MYKVAIWVLLEEEEDESEGTTVMVLFTTQFL